MTDDQKKKIPHLHPICVHFPQALFPAAFAAAVAYLALGIREFEVGAYICVLFGLLSVPAATLSGIIDWKLRFKGAMTRVFKIKIAGSALLVALALPAVLLRAYHPDLLLHPFQGAGLGYLLLLAACAADCTVLGFYGGRLVFH
ncbi:hypothetical protein FO488_10630 [Geobacter sp. FeAm09]|uniref:DUF2231 domain-containing protein n=1 Tax=Geobacter sp. FeAm09 TaxID=2597769 RepID=UPI0011ED7F81|nr:DUF2231 domain-containing protein [Geobacter sp. FeAm09]QEM68579.1 hypothetical protein FO488_10630 [Geobacter sp. FeAm09]